MISKKYINNLLIRTFISLIILTIISACFKNDLYYYELHKIIFRNNIDFSYIRSKTNYLLGKYITNQDHYVSSEKLLYKDIEYNNNKNILTVDYNYIINSLCDGVVVNKVQDEVIVDCDNYITITYKNIENININLYDYIKKDTLIGNTIDNKLILTIKDKENYIRYEEYN